MRLVAIWLVLGAALFLIGCASKPSIEGTWLGQNGNLEIELTLAPDGKFKMTIMGPNRETEMMLHVEQSGTYSLVPSNGTLKLDTQEVKVKGVQDGMAQVMEEGIRRKNNEEAASKYEMPDPDTLKLTGSEGSTTFKRKKS